MGAIVLGVVAGIGSFWAVSSLKRALGYDDSLDVFGVHGVAGIIGALGIGILASPSFGGTGFGGDNASIGAQLGVQALSVGFTLVYTGVLSYILLKIIDMVIGLRVTDEAETEGLDVAEHGEAAYTPAWCWPCRCRACSRGSRHRLPAAVSAGVGCGYCCWFR
jgi:Amt family ammonium transporter